MASAACFDGQLANCQGVDSGINRSEGSVAVRKRTIPKRLSAFQRHLSEHGIETKLHFSKRGVPMLIISERPWITACWFGRKKLIRIFSPNAQYPGDQDRADARQQDGELYVKACKIVKTVLKKHGLSGAV